MEKVIQQVASVFSIKDQMFFWAAGETRSDCVITCCYWNSLSLPSYRWSGKTLNFAGQNGPMMQHHLYLLGHWPNFWGLLKYWESKTFIMSTQVLQCVEIVLVVCDVLPCTVREMCLWATPAGFRAEHVYLPAWLGTAAVISNTPALNTVTHINIKWTKILFALCIVFW